MTFVWHSLCAALLPIKIQDIPDALDRFLAHLACHNDGERERAIPAFERHLRQNTG